MSLLLDARKKIELALDQTGVHHTIEPQLSESLRLEEPSVSAVPSHASSAGNPGTAPPLRGDPVAAPARSTPTGAPPLRGDPVAAPARSTPTGAPPLRGDPVAAGKNLFAAKSSPVRGRGRLGIIPVALISGAVIAAGGGYYVWREITPPAQAIRQAPKPQPASPIANAAPPPAPASAAPTPATMAPAQESLPAAPQIPPNPPLQKGGAAGGAVTDMATAPSSPSQKGGAAAGDADAVLAATSLPPLQKGGRGGFAAQPKQEAASFAQNETVGEEALPAPPAPGIRIERGPQQASAVDPNLLAAWQAYRDGDFSAAGRRYGDILKQDAKSRDALLGMAAIAQQQARDDEAAHYYRQVLALDPRDPVAHAGMLSLLGPGNEAGAESRLKLLLAQQPQSPALHFALGNLYAEQSRWGDAQQSYFSAGKLEPDNAQFAFNLAVSLDHLGKGELAAQHYRRALQLDTAASPTIDRTQTQRRLNELTPAH